MYFCPKCSYSYDIVKATSKETRIPIAKVVDVIKFVESKEDLSKYIAEFPKEEIMKNKKYQKMNDIDKKNINCIFDENVSQNAIFKCNNCNNVENINKTILLYNLNMNEDVLNNSSIEENKFICNDPILPRTHDYICKNVDCITNKDINRKDAIFYKDNSSYKVNYICTLCFYNW